MPNKAPVCLAGSRVVGMANVCSHDVYLLVDMMCMCVVAAFCFNIRSVRLSNGCFDKNSTSNPTTLNVYKSVDLPRKMLVFHRRLDSDLLSLCIALQKIPVNKVVKEDSYKRFKFIF